MLSFYIFCLVCLATHTANAAPQSVLKNDVKPVVPRDLQKPKTTGRGISDESDESDESDSNEDSDENERCIDEILHNRNGINGHFQNAPQTNKYDWRKTPDSQHGNTYGYGYNSNTRYPQPYGSPFPSNYDNRPGYQRFNSPRDGYNRFNHMYNGYGNNDKKPLKKNKHKTNKTENKIVLNNDDLVINGKKVPIKSTAKQGITVNLRDDSVTVNKKKIPGVKSKNSGVSVQFKDDTLSINGKKVPGVNANQGQVIKYDKGVLKVDEEKIEEFTGIKGKGRIVWGENSSSDSVEDSDNDDESDEDDIEKKYPWLIRYESKINKLSQKNKRKTNKKKIDQSSASIVFNDDGLVINGKKVPKIPTAKQGITVNFSDDSVTVNKKKIPGVVSKNPGVNVQFKDDTLSINGKKVPGVKANQGQVIKYDKGVLKVDEEKIEEFNGIKGKGRIVWGENSSTDSDEKEDSDEEENNDWVKKYNAHLKKKLRKNTKKYQK
ncbi:uncharacterized protein LOC126833000 isoform X2 [Adelges cooleyi]|uniref:uncharacterized protein LOC126833000 isoform X2 n=1 Tax=Adelges cooleyi TaxID=133065 RepID=UPI00218060D6|nr:uncharacterized protein LOC126833000 isoform X2 [Adelges cooleyi]